MAAAKSQAVGRLATDWTFRGSNSSGCKLNTTRPRSHVFLFLHGVRKLPVRKKYRAVAFCVGRLSENLACSKTNFPIVINVK